MILDSPFTEGKPYPKRVYYEAKSLVDNGYDVTIYCKNEKDMDIPKFEIRDGIKINRCFDYFLGTTVLADKYLTAHFDLMNSITEKYDIYHCHDPNTWPIGYILSQRDNAKFICETHEFFPDYICEDWYMDKFKYDITKMLVKARGDYFRYGDKTIAVSEDMADELHKTLNLRERPTVIYNTRPKKFINQSQCNDTNKKNYLRYTYGIDENTNILLFQGILHKLIGIDVAIDITRYLDDCVLLIVGDNLGDYGSELNELVQKNNLDDKVIFTGYKPSEELFMYSTYADYLIYFGRKIVRNIDLTIPNKFFDYLIAGKPIISSNLKAVSKLVNQNNIGICLDIENTSTINLAKEISLYINNKELTNLAKSNMKNIQESYTWEKQEEKLLALYKDLE